MILAINLMEKAYAYTAHAFFNNNNNRLGFYDRQLFKDVFHNFR
jgi:hypothetical protein